jgi:phosphate transport system permease protein
VRTIEQTSARRRRQDRAFAVLGAVLTATGIAVLCLLIGNLLVEGLSRIDWAFFKSEPSRKPERAGILVPLLGSLAVMAVTALVSLPLGVAAGVYLEEYAPKNRFTTIVEVNIANLAGVPSIIYGLMSLGVFVYFLHLGHSVLTAGLTLAMLILPIVIVATREALRTIPKTIREASYALGATKWETVRHHLIPYSIGGIATGAILGMSRAIGETAPLVVVGALAYVSTPPPAPVQATFPFVSFAWLDSTFSVLPFQMFNWLSRPDPGFRTNAAATGVVLIAITLTMNAIAITVRYRMRKRIRW